MPDFVLGRRNRQPSFVEYFRQEVPFRTDYEDFRLELVTHRRTRGGIRPLRERMLFDERRLTAAQREAGYRYHPEVLIEEHEDLRSIHRGFAAMDTDDGDVVRLMVYLFRDADRWVLAIRVATIGIQTLSFDPERVEGLVHASAASATRKALEPMEAAVGHPPELRGAAGWSAIGYSRAQLEYMEWLDAYRDSLTLVLMTAPANPRMDEPTREVEPHLFPEIQAHQGLDVGGRTEQGAHPYWEGPAAYPVRLHAAQRALHVWNNVLSTGEREAAHIRFLDIMGRLNRLYETARDRMME